MLILNYLELRAIYKKIYKKILEAIYKKYYKLQQSYKLGAWTSPRVTAPRASTRAP
jgi:hypothetical protein